MKTVYIERNNLFKDINMIMCNNINTIDENFVEDNMHIFYDDCDTCEGIGEIDGETCEECQGDGRHDCEPYQYFLANLDEWQIENLKAYGIEVGYSNLLELSIIPIYDYGTSWSMFSHSKEVEDDYILSYNETLERKTHY